MSNFPKVTTIIVAFVLFIVHLILGTLDSNLSMNRCIFRNRNQSATRVSLKKPANKCLQNNLIYAMYLPVWFEDENVSIDS